MDFVLYHRRHKIARAKGTRCGGQASPWGDLAAWDGYLRLLVCFAYEAPDLRGAMTLWCAP